MDRIVGEVMRAAPEGTRIFVVSDHGFAPFRRGVNLNNFLREHGYQVAHGAAGPQVLRSLDGGAFFSDVDWEHTAAYSMGLGNIYLNLVGRQPRGYVPLQATEQVLADITRDLLEIRDKDGTKVVRRVFRGSEIYHGGRADEAPDLVVGFESGYRVSWQTCLGGCDPELITDNTQRWSADHCSVDPDLVPGILFSSIPIVPEIEPSVLDVAPSVLSLFGVPPNDPDGRSFLTESP